MSADVINALADKLAQATLSAMEETGDDRLYEAVALELGKTSPSLEEAFVNVIRLHLTAKRGFQHLEELRAKAAPQTTP